MNVSAHPLQIATLATWLSVAAAGTVGLMWHRGHVVMPDDGRSEITLALSDIVLGTERPADAADGNATTSDDATVEETEVTEDFPAPPEMPAVSDAGPLPEVPDLPVRPAATPTTRSRTEARTTPSRPRASANSSGTRGNGGTGMSDAARMAAGSMPAPSYPPEARRRGQTGSVVVEFTVDAAGRVISAYAKSPSPWPLLNDEAVRTVRRWKFPPGGVMKLQRPIVFKLR